MEGEAKDEHVFNAGYQWFGIDCRKAAGRGGGRKHGQRRDDAYPDRRALSPQRGRIFVLWESSFSLDAGEIQPHAEWQPASCTGRARGGLSYSVVDAI